MTRSPQGLPPRGPTTVYLLRHAESRPDAPATRSHLDPTSTWPYRIFCWQLEGWLGVQLYLEYSTSRGGRKDIAWRTGWLGIGCAY